MKRIITHWLPFAIFLGFIYFLSTMSKPIPLDISMNISFLHPIEFFVLAFLLLRALHAHNVKYAFVITILLATLFGFIDEIIQSYIPGRTSTLIDVGLDTIGASFVLIFKNKKLEKILEYKNKQA